MYQKKINDFDLQYDLIFSTSRNKSIIISHSSRTPCIFPNFVYTSSNLKPSIDCNCRKKFRASNSTKCSKVDEIVEMSPTINDGLRNCDYVALKMNYFKRWNRYRLFVLQRRQRESRLFDVTLCLVSARQNEF